MAAVQRDVRQWRRPALHGLRDSSLEAYEELANVQDSQEAQIALGWMYYTGEGTKKDIEKAKHWFGDLWNSINAKRGYGWDSNPWVWVLEFRRVGND